MPGVSIIDFLEGFYGEALMPGREKAFHDFSPEKAEEMADRYRVVVEREELAYARTILSKTSLLLVKNISPIATHSVGGDQILLPEEEDAYIDARGIYISRPPQLPAESFLDWVVRTKDDKSDSNYTEEEVRANRIENLKTLLLLVPSITIPDQVWGLATYMMIQSEIPGANYQDQLGRRWKSYIAFLAAVRPLITQGAIRIVSACRMSRLACSAEGNRKAA